MTNAVKKWKKKTYIEAEILITDWFYAKTPDLSDNEVWPFTKNAEKKVLNQKVKRSTIEEVDLVLEEKGKHEEISENNNSIPEIKKTA